MNDHVNNNVVSLNPSASSFQVAFDRRELNHILNLYGRLVAAGELRDYAIDLGNEAAVFSAFKRAAERPDFSIEKRPSLRNRQGMWALINTNGFILKRGHELALVLAPIERRLIKIAD